MRALFVLLAVAAVLGCKSGEPVEMVNPTEVGIEGMYTLSRCNDFVLTPPCYTYLSGTSTSILDSARVTLNRDGTGSLMTASRDGHCPASPPPSCGTDTVYAQSPVTYLISGNHVIVYPVGNVNATFDFSTHIPSLVPKGWSGPDTLTTYGGVNGGTTRSVTFKRVL